MTLDDYASIVGEPVIEELREVARRLQGRQVVHVNSTAVGGGVAEILNRMVPLMQDLGIGARWEVIRGGDPFYAVTKKIHNGLHGADVELTGADREVYWDAQRQNARLCDLGGDIVFIHDPQPAGLIEVLGREGRRWAWRCHVDVSAPAPAVWDFLRPIVERYEAGVFSAPGFAQQLPIRQALIAPSIDPLSDKNKDLPAETVRDIVERLGVAMDRPIVTQVSRFDRLKDPLGVIEAWLKVKPYIDSQLVLAGGSAADDPEGAQVLSEVRERAAGDPDIHILELPPTSHVEINALQRASAVILQKSLKEGFGLTVSEALWKGKPVIAGAVGGIPLQIVHKHSGILTHSVDGTAYWLKQLLQAPDYARKLGENGREHVRDNFLLTRHLRDYLLLFLSLDHADQDVVYLD